MQVKFCGMTTTEDIRLVNELRPDLVGMVLFFEKSKRNLTIRQAGELLSLLSPEILPVAVMVSPSPEQAKSAQEAGFAYLQIHGEITPGVLSQTSIPILKAFNLSDLDQLERYQKDPRIAGYVFDAAEPGSGKTFDWTMLSQIPRSGKLCFLAGGLTPENVAEAIRTVHPDGVDVSSGIEYGERQGKDPEKARRFLQALDIFGD